MHWIIIHRRRVMFPLCLLKCSLSFKSNVVETGLLHTGLSRLVTQSFLSNVREDDCVTSQKNVSIGGKMETRQEPAGFLLLIFLFCFCIGCDERPLVIRIKINYSVNCTLMLFIFFQLFKIHCSHVFW